MASHPKLIIIGIDSATWDLMDPWLAEGELPNIASVLRHGGRSELRSVVPPITGCAWPTIMTGTNPGRHGMFGFATYEDGYAPRPISNRDRRAPALWEMLNHHGLTVGVYNVPMTYPCDDVDGYMVSGEMGAVEYGPSMFRPRHLFDELRRAVPRYELAPVVRGMREEDGVERLAAQVEARRKAAAYLLEKHPTDVFIAVVNYVDHVQHRFMTTRSFADIDDMVLWAYR
ncbi:MAG: alkaline phosphatase family protein, partial [Armatimonadota bacterium]